jgi:ribonuclease-3
LNANLEELLGHSFSRPELLQQALTHRSAVPGKRRTHGSNERLEFVGDRVLGLLIAEWLAERYPQEHEGDLGHRLAHLVSRPVLAEVADSIGLGAALSVAPGEARAGVKRLATVLSDGLEAALGALYLDGGLDAARAFVRRVWQQPIELQQLPPKDAKSRLQELAHARGKGLPEYAVQKRSGPPHAPEFVVTVTVGEDSGTGAAGSKRKAQQAAATELLKALSE